MTTDVLTTQPCETLDSRQLAGVSEIYEQAFPDHLRVPFEQLAEVGPRQALLVALDHGVPVGFAATKVLDSADWIFLRYFAIAAGRRRQRVGQRFWELLRQSAAAEGRPGRIVFEVEDPAEARDDSEERLVRENRISFWLSCGAVPLPVPGYVMPDLVGLAAPEPMLLMAAPYAAEVRGDQLRALVLAIYTDRYGVLPGDLLARQALESISRS